MNTNSDNTKAKLAKAIEEANSNRDMFLAASAKSINLSFLHHETDKIMGWLEECIEEGNLPKIKEAFAYLKQTTGLYTDAICNVNSVKIKQVKSIVDQVVWMSNYRFKSHSIKCKVDLESKLEVLGSKGLLVGVVVNLVDNAIIWMDLHKIENKQIYIKSYSTKKEVCIVVADNGKGFSIDFEDALKPYITQRNDDGGTGLGLNIVAKAMEAHKGKVMLSNYRAEKLPRQYANGAIVKLVFPKVTASKKKLMKK